jgi:hypothetical protein
MVAAPDVSLCCFCGSMVHSDEAGYTRADELYCRACGERRGLTEYVWSKNPQSDDRQILQGVDGLGDYEITRGGGPGSRGTAKVVIPITGGMDGDKSAWVRKSPMEKTADQHVRLYQRALLWLPRDQTVAPEDIVAEADALAQLPVHDARAAIEALKFDIYRQHHQPRDFTKYRKLSDAQVETIRQRYVSGTESFQRLGREFGVSGATISQVVTGSTYKHAGGPIHIPEPDRISGLGYLVRERMGWSNRSHNVAGKRLEHAATGRLVAADLESSTSHEFDPVVAVDDGA